jgi:serine kinase of HPr protein (carbohydrate metabolism regulator)
MKIETLTEKINARLVSHNADQSTEVEYAFASDLMSDVLTIGEHAPMLITGLSNLQTIRTAEMADIKVIVLARGKKASPEMISLAQENEITIVETPYSVFKTSGILYKAGIKPIF